MPATTENSMKKTRSKSVLRDYAEAIIIALVLALVIRAFVIQAFKIPSGSMKPTLLVGDHILVNKFIYGIRLPYWNTEIIPIDSPKRHDIVVFRYPVDPSKDFIKRVIGLPGDTVRIQGKQVFVNDQPLVEPYAVHSDSRILPASASPRDNLDPLVVPRIPCSFWVTTGMKAMTAVSGSLSTCLSSGESLHHLLVLEQRW